MNRMKLWTPEPTVSDVDLGVFTRSARHRLPHSLFAPLHYERNYAYPLLVWLHGRGGDEHQLRRVMPLISMRNYVAVAPRGIQVIKGSSRGFGWGDSDTATAAATRRVFQCIDAAMERFNIAPQRVFLVGCDCGGTAAFRVGFGHAARFAGILSVGGPFPGNGRPLAGLRQARQLPLFIAQGRDSQQYPVERTCEELRLFHAAGFSVTLRQYPCGDELTTQMLHDIDVWVMEQVTGVPSESEHVSTHFLDLN